jgi:cytochrome bd-type quinol oxidase subunit 2
MMVKTGRELRKSLILSAAADYRQWENQRRFWRRVSITCAVIAIFFFGVAVGMIV